MEIILVKYYLDGSNICESMQEINNHAADNPQDSVMIKQQF